jgi:hypothetical protein
VSVAFRPTAETADRNRFAAKQTPRRLNGGPTPTLLPLPISPVIDAGDPAFAPPPTEDQRGLPRVINVTIDIGAVERQVREDEIFRDNFENN